RIELGEALSEGGALPPQLAVLLQGPCDLRLGEAVQRFALRLGAPQALLIGLAVAGHSGADEPSEGPDRHRHSPDLGAGAAIAGDAADHEHLAVLLLRAELVEGVCELGVAGEGEVPVHGAGTAGGTAAVQAPAEQHG